MPPSVIFSSFFATWDSFVKLYFSFSSVKLDRFSLRSYSKNRILVAWKRCVNQAFVQVSKTDRVQIKNCIKNPRIWFVPSFSACSANVRSSTKPRFFSIFLPSFVENLVSWLTEPSCRLFSLTEFLARASFPELVLEWWTTWRLVLYLLSVLWTTWTSHLRWG